jgi:hypothetical protein
MFNLAIDSKLRGRDVVSLTVDDVAPNGVAVDRATVRQTKTGHPVRFELSEQTREAFDAYIRAAHKKAGEFRFTSRHYPGHTLTTRRYARLVSRWIAGIGLDPALYGTHPLRRPRPRSSIAKRQPTCRAAPTGATAESKALSDTLVSKWTMHWPSPSRKMSELPAQSRLAVPSSLGRLRANTGLVRRNHERFTPCQGWITKSIPGARVLQEAQQGE